jgi:NAD-dependent oxidoreductase involved in siderophore biosynthesis
VLGAFVRSRSRATTDGVPLATIQIDQDVLQGIECDVVVNALPGLEPSTQLITAFLKRGVDVVSANKAVMADSGSALGALATRYEASLRYSATVGGSARMIEAVRRIAASGNITSVTATLSGTCNFVLEQCARGVSLHVAVHEAQVQITISTMLTTVAAIPNPAERVVGPMSKSKKKNRTTTIPPRTTKVTEEEIRNRGEKIAVQIEELTRLLATAFERLATRKQVNASAR